MTLQNCVVCKKCCKFTISLCKNEFGELCGIDGNTTLWFVTMFRNFLLVPHAKFVVPVFQGGDLCRILR